MDPTVDGQPPGDSPQHPAAEDKRRWWVWALAVVAVLGIVVAAVLIWGGDDEVQTGAPPGTSTTAATSTTTSTSTSTPDTTTTAPSSTATTPGGAVPGAVAGVSAEPGGGSGEVALNWDAMTGATGYRVLRSATASGPFVTAADLNVTTGTTTAAAEAVNIWSAQHSYLPSDGPLGAPDTSPRFQYVEVGGAGQRCFQVVAYNAAGDGPGSVVSCGSPP